MATGAIGYHTRTSGLKGGLTEEQALSHNFINIFGYLPGIGGFVSYSSRRDLLSKTYVDHPTEKAFRRTCKIRAVVEVCGLGAAFIPLDLAVSIARLVHKTNKNEN